MKSLVLCVCVLIIGSSNSTHPNELSRDEIAAIQNDISICMTENGLTESLLYSVKDIMANEHIKPENQERTKNTGCFVACGLKKQNLIEGSHIKEDEVLAKLNMFSRNDKSDRLNAIVRKCMVEVRSITPQCEKGLSVYTCLARGIHEAEEREKNEVKAEETVTETEQDK